MFEVRAYCQSDVTATEFREGAIAALDQLAHDAAGRDSDAGGMAVGGLRDWFWREPRLNTATEMADRLRAAGFTAQVREAITHD